VSRDILCRAMMDVGVGLREMRLLHDALMGKQLARVVLIHYL